MTDTESPFFRRIDYHRSTGTRVKITRLDENGEPTPDAWVALAEPVDMTTFTVTNLSREL